MKTPTRLTFVLTLFLLGLTAAANAKPKKFEWVRAKLEAKTISPKFISRLQRAASDEKQDKIIQLSVFGFLKKADYSGHISDDTFIKSRAFMKKNHQALRLAEKRYSLQPEAITALLWVETRQGKRMGSFHLIDVFMNLAMADEPKTLEQTLLALKEEVPEGDPQWTTLPAKIKSVSFNKSQWAVDQLVALASIEKKYHSPIFKIKGSYAGAFGIPQFIPTSYLVYADAPESRAPRDLFKTSHAILSVAKYLHMHGWDKTIESRKEALWGYNRSRVYGETILEIASRLGMKTDPTPSPAPTEKGDFYQ